MDFSAEKVMTKGSEVDPTVGNNSGRNTKNSFFKNSSKKVLVTEIDTSKIQSAKKKIEVDLTARNKKNYDDLGLNKEKVRYDLIKIWSNLSQGARKELLEQKLDEAELFVNTKKTLKELMQNFSLQDSVLFENRRLLSSSKVPLSSRKTLNFLKSQYLKKQNFQKSKSKSKRFLKNFARIKNQKLRLLKQGNQLRHRTTLEHQLNLIKEINSDEPSFVSNPTRMDQAFNKTREKLGFSPSAFSGVHRHFGGWNVQNIRTDGSIQHKMRTSMSKTGTKSVGRASGTFFGKGTTSNGFRPKSRSNTFGLIGGGTGKGKIENTGIVKLG